MLILNEAQRRFVLAFIAHGGNQTRAAIDAGYFNNPESPETIRRTGYRLAHDSKIQAAMHEMAIGMMNAGKLDAVKLALETIRNPAVEMKDRLKAAQMVMDRTGLHATTEQKMTVKHVDETSDQLIKEITQLSKTLGVDPKRLLGGKVIEGEVEEVKNDEDDIGDLL